MSEILTSPAPQSETEYETTLKQISVEIDYLNGLMAQDRKDIERLKAETDLLKIETRAILATMGVGV